MMNHSEKLLSNVDIFFPPFFQYRVPTKMLNVSISYNHAGRY